MATHVNKQLLLGVLVGFLISLSRSRFNRPPDVNEILPTLKQKQVLVTKPVYNIPNEELRTTIREWGCNRSETPFIFVHLGKAGGGSVRNRLKGSSLNFGSDDPYYHVSDTIKAIYCNSCFTQRRPSREETYEQTHWCHATTPIGRAIACPEGYEEKNPIRQQCRNKCHINSTECNIVYAGHNLIGSEFHWLPYRLLSKWWDSIAPHAPLPWQWLDPQNTWCGDQPRPKYTGDYKEHYEHCNIPMARHMDALANNAISPNQTDLVDSWAPVYASLPVLRATVLREPFAWIVSKFFWHEYHLKFKCDDLLDATEVAYKYNGKGGYQTVDMPRTQDFGEYGNPGWLRVFCLNYIFYYCGEDCVVRYASGLNNLAELERQAEENIRHSFAVVGILEELDDFYRMVHARVRYIDTTRNNGEGEKDRHSTGDIAAKCKEKFQDPSFQQHLLAASPELRAVNRLYKVGQQVKEFQMQELQKCVPSLFR